jgi:hypothetical protein
MTASDCVPDDSHLLDCFVRGFSYAASNYFAKIYAAFLDWLTTSLSFRHKAEAYQAGEITREEYDYADTLKRSELPNMAFYIQSLGEIVTLVIIVGIMFGINVNASSANNN